MKPAPLSLFDIGCGFSALGFAPLTTDEQALADQIVADRFNRTSRNARLVLTGPVLPDGVWIGDTFHRGVYDPVWKRWRTLGLKPPPPFELRLHHESAKVRGVLVPTKQGPVISRAVNTGWALDPATFSTSRLVVGDVVAVELKRGSWFTSASVSPEQFRKEADRHWERILRQRVAWQRFAKQWWRAASAKERAERRLQQYMESAAAIVYYRPYRPSFWNVRDYSHSVRLRWKNGTVTWARGQYGKPVYPSCVSPYGQVYYLARWAELKPPAEQHCLKHIGRLYRQNIWSRYRRDLAQREHFGVWTDKSAQRADGRKVKERPKNRPLTVAERLKEWQRGDDEVRRRDRSAEERARAQENTIAAFVHDWQRRDVEATLAKYRYTNPSAVVDDAKTYGENNGSRHVVGGYLPSRLKRTG